MADDWNDPKSPNASYRVDAHYFDEIDTEQKAYFLGLLYADGTNRTGTGDICLKLQKKDEHLVHSLREAIRYTGPLQEYRPCSPFKKAQSQVRVAIRNRRLSESLARLGCIANKSLVCKFPGDIPGHLVRHFVRGYFDGDGWACVPNSRNTPHIGFICSVPFSVGLSNWLISMLGPGVPRMVPAQLKTANVYVCKLRSIKSLFHLFYNGASIFLKRKYDKFLLATNREDRTVRKTPDERRLKTNATTRAWRRANPEKVCIFQKRARDKGKEKYAISAKKYRAEHREKYQ